MWPPAMEARERRIYISLDVSRGGAIYECVPVARNDAVAMSGGGHRHLGLIFGGVRNPIAGSERQCSGLPDRWLMKGI
jgi:hypothetical protein